MVDSLKEKKTLINYVSGTFPIAVGLHVQQVKIAFG